MKKKIFALIVTAAMIISVMPNVWATPDESAALSAKLTFTADGVTETQAGNGYTVDGTVLTVTAAGIYQINGSCEEGSIVVNKGLSGVILIFDGLSLASGSTAPVVVKKSANVTIHLSGENTLADNENPENEFSSDQTVADTYEGAAIKVKSGSTVTFCGDGNLNIAANSKNGIKGGSTASLIFNQSGTVTVSGSGKYNGGTKSGAAVNSGIACDGSIVFNQGTYVIKAAGDAVRSAPDATDKTAGTKIDNASAGEITVNGGTFDIDADGDGFDADTALTVNGGVFDIQTRNGYGEWNNTLADTYSCKGLKAGGARAAEAELETAVTVTGGTFTINTGDDAIHADKNVTITGGVFTIQTGDDGIHAGKSLTLGTENGLSRDPDITINNSYEGLEGGNVYIYSGRFYVNAYDDGVNAAGGSGNGSDPGGGGGHGFFPGGGPGGHGGPVGPGGGAASNDYNIYIYGGDLYVNCQGDGIDSNGGLYLYGGRQAVFSMQSDGDNSALDASGSVLIDGATVFTAGTTGVDGSVKNSWFGDGQKFKTSSARYNAGKIIETTVSSSGRTIFSYALQRNVSYIMASWPSSVSSSTPAIAESTSVTPCAGGSWSHDWDAGTTSGSVITYTCGECGETESRTVPAGVKIPKCSHLGEEEPEEDQGFAVAFAGDEGVDSITVYMTQDYAGESESVGANGAAVSRNSDTGKPDSSKSGQVNFTVVVKDGYALSDVTATAGTYKNIKGPSDTGLANTYRITKIEADTTVTITTVACAHGKIADGTTPGWVWSENCGSAILSYTCAECGGEVRVAGTITSELTDETTITFTAKASLGETEYTDTKTADPFTAAFECDEGVAAIIVYYTHDYTVADDENAETAVARSSDSGDPVVNGDGQINFKIILKDGYTLDSVSATAGAYKNIKGPADTAEENTYRITKITKDLTITVSTTSSGSGPEYAPGDCNNDGQIDNKDIVTLFRYVSVNGTGADPLVFDINEDGSIDNKDVVALFRSLSTL